MVDGLLLWVEVSGSRLDRKAKKGGFMMSYINFAELNPRLLKAVRFLHQNEVDPGTALYMPGSARNLAVKGLDQLQVSGRAIRLEDLYPNVPAGSVYEPLALLEAWISITKQDRQLKDRSWEVAGRTTLPVALRFTALYIQGYHTELDTQPVSQFPVYRNLRGVRPDALDVKVLCENLQCSLADLKANFVQVASMLSAYSTSHDGTYRNLYVPDPVKSTRGTGGGSHRSEEDARNLVFMDKLLGMSQQTTRDFLQTLPNYLLKDLASRGSAYMEGKK